MRVKFTGLLVALLCVFTVLAGCNKPEPTPNKPFTGSYYLGDATILLDDAKGVATIVNKGSTPFQLNDTFLRVIERTGSNTWKADVYDEDITFRSLGSVTLESQILTVYPKDASSYELRALSSGSSSSGTGTGNGSTSNGSTGSSGSGSGCSSVQCSGTTKSGARCKRTTTNCSGRCYQH